MGKRKFNWGKFWSKEILAPECDALCRWRQCYTPGENKGCFTPGKGYTSYHAEPTPVCVTRMNHGCGNRRSLPPDYTNMLEDCNIVTKTGKTLALASIRPLLKFLIEQNPQLSKEVDQNAD